MHFDDCCLVSTGERDLTEYNNGKPSGNLCQDTDAPDMGRGRALKKSHLQGVSIFCQAWELLQGGAKALQRQHKGTHCSICIAQTLLVSTGKWDFYCHPTGTQTGESFAHHIFPKKKHCLAFLFLLILPFMHLLGACGRACLCM